MIDEIDQRGEVEGGQGEPMEELITMPLGNDPKKVVQVGAQLPFDLKEELLSLKKNSDVFAWSTINMLGISVDVIVHRLNVDPNYKPEKQKKRKFAPERHKVIEEEVDKLLKVEFIQETHYPEWMANVVMVKKANGKQWICIDYTNPNKTYLKDNFSLSSIDQLVDATFGH